MDRISGARVVAPDCDLTLWAARDFLASPARTRRVDDLDPALQQRHAVRFDQCVMRKRAAGFPLTPAAVAAMHEQRTAVHPITHESAGTPTVIWVFAHRRSVSSIGAIVPSFGALGQASRHAPRPS